MGTYPSGNLVIPQLIGFQHYTAAGDSFVKSLALVCRGPAHQDDKHGRIEAVLNIDGKFLEVTHGLGIADDDKLTFCHHREASGRRDDSLGIHITAVADGLVEVTRKVVKSILADPVADFV